MKQGAPGQAAGSSSLMRSPPHRQYDQSENIAQGTLDLKDYLRGSRKMQGKDDGANNAAYK